MWLGWLELYAHGDVEAIDSPIGLLPKYEDLKTLFSTLIDKDYSRELYDKQFSIYVENILARVALQREAFGKEKNLPGKLFEIYDEWAAGLALESPDNLSTAPQAYYFWFPFQQVQYAAVLPKRILENAYARTQNR